KPSRARSPRRSARSSRRSSTTRTCGCGRWAPGSSLWGCGRRDSSVRANARPNRSQLSATSPLRPHRGIGSRPMADQQQWVYDFAEGSKDMRDLLGGKGANVAEMTRVLGADRVPAGFTITTEACVAYMRAKQHEPDGMAEQVQS